MDPNTEQKPATTETPPPAPASDETPPAAEGVVEGGSDLFSELATDVEDEDSTEEVLLPETPPKGTTPPPASEAKPPEKPAVETPPAPVETPPASAVQPPATPPVDTPPPPTPTEEERKAQFEKDRAAAMAKLVENYAIPEDLAPVLISEPEKALPQLMATLHARVMENVVQYMQQALPQAVRHVSTVESEQSKAAQAFFNEWPELKDEKYGPTVARVLAGYRQANPDASREDVIREGGVAALVALRMPIPERVLKRHNVETPDATKSGGFVPATPGAVRTPPTRQSENIFTVLAEQEVE